MGHLITASRFGNPDAAFVALMEARRGLGEEASAGLDPRIPIATADTPASTSRKLR